MPIRIEFTNDEMGVILYHEGMVTGEELISAISDVHQDSRFLKLRYWIGDRTRCDRFLPNRDCMQRITSLNEKHAKRNSGIFLALISPTDYEYGMSRMYQVFAEKAFSEIEIFRDRASADNWIEKKLDISDG